MPYCEICSREVLRRKRTKRGRLVCRRCFYLIEYPDNAAYEIHKLEKKLEYYRQNHTIKDANRKYRFNSPFSAVPPRELLQNAIYALDTVSGYSHGFNHVLADYYEIEAPPYYHNSEKVPENAIACYYRNANIVYSRDSTLSQKTAFHEMWHALESFGVVPRTENSERDADRYAYACLKRLTTS